MEINVKVYSDCVEIPVPDSCSTELLLSFLSVMGIDAPHNIYTRDGCKVLQWTHAGYSERIFTKSKHDQLR